MELDYSFRTKRNIEYSVFQQTPSSRKGRGDTSSGAAGFCLGKLRRIIKKRGFHRERGRTLGWLSLAPGHRERNWEVVKRGSLVISLDAPPHPPVCTLQDCGSFATLLGSRHRDEGAVGSPREGATPPRSGPGSLLCFSRLFVEQTSSLCSPLTASERLRPATVADVWLR